MPIFNGDLILPDLPVHLQRGGVSSLLYIQMKDDLSAVETSAEWNALLMLRSKNLNVSEGATSSKSDLTETLIDGVRYSLTDEAASDGVDKEELQIVIPMSALEIFNLKNSVKGKKFFIVDPILFVGTTKYVQFGIAEFGRTFSRNGEYGSFIATNATLSFLQRPSTYPTLPALPTNTDVLFTTDAVNMKYLGWLLPVADAAKGGFGAAVTLPIEADWPVNILTVAAKFSV